MVAPQCQSRSASASASGLVVSRTETRAASSPTSGSVYSPVQRAEVLRRRTQKRASLQHAQPSAYCVQGTRVEGAWAGRGSQGLVGTLNSVPGWGRFTLDRLLSPTACRGYEDRAYPYCVTARAVCPGAPVLLRERTVD